MRRGRPIAADPRRGTAAPTRARLLAYRVLARVDQTDAYADLVLHGALGRTELASVDRGLVTELVYGTLRWRGNLDFLIAHFSDRPLEALEPPVRTLLRMGAYQLVFMDRVPNSAAVDQTVRCAHAAGVGRAAGFVNALLRRLAAKHAEVPVPSIEDDALGHLVHALSLPEWLAQRWIDRFGAEQAAALARASNAAPPVTLRASLHGQGRDALLAELRERVPGARACEHAPQGIRLGHGGDPGRDPAFIDGRFTVQDEASQLVIELLDPQPGESVLDLCAAPGAKATAIAERVGPRGRVLATDRNARRLRLVGRDARRLGLGNLGTVQADATAGLPSAAAAGSFDRVLVDAPCSGLGTLRRNPDARWRLSAEDPARFASTQAALLRTGALALRPGGVLVYSCCTFAPEETTAVVARFLAESADFRRAQGDVPASLAGLLGPEGTLETFPHRHDMDGFHAARLERRPE
jgi:16S rRNA (cytosine967-C5)-methyltransferase